MAVCRIDGDDVNLCGDERGNALHRVCGRADSRADEKPAVFVTRGVGILDALFDVLDRDQAFEIAVFVDDGKFFDPVFAENLLRLFQRGAHRSRDEVLLRHDIVDGLIVVGFKAEIAVCKDADELAVLRDGNAADLVALHQRDRLADAVVGREEERIGDDAVLAPLDLVDLARLFLDAHVLMNDADTALPRERNGKFTFRDGVHRRTHKRDVEFEIVRELRVEIDARRKHVGSGGDQQHIVKSKTFLHNLVHKRFSFLICCMVKNGYQKN